MKDQKLNDKFPKCNNFVRPLYKKIERKSAPTNENLAVFRSKTTKVGKLENEEGIDRNVKIYERNLVVNGGIIKRDERFYISEETLPGVCQALTTDRKSRQDEPAKNSIVNLSGDERNGHLNVSFAKEKSVDPQISRLLNVKSSLREKQALKFNQHLNEWWLRVLPAPAPALEEPWHAAVLRLALCQVGLAVLLLLWTAASATLLYCAERPHEEETLADSAHQRKRLAVDLATELRQISVVSPSWLKAIERRLDEVRQETIAAGSRARSTLFWDPYGAALFTILVMAVMGFGAPMPQTTLGRTTALIFALLAIPMHLFLVTNASNAVMSLMEYRLQRYRSRVQNSDRSVGAAKNCQLRILSLLCSNRCVILALTAYYAVGMLSFGFSRGLGYQDAILFPLRFTAGGGLEEVPDVVRVCYAVYVEGAAVLAACAWRAARRRVATTLAPVAEEYKLLSCTDGSQRN